MSKKNSPTALLEEDVPSAFLSKTFGILEVYYFFRERMFIWKFMFISQRNELHILFFLLPFSIFSFFSNKI